MLNGLLGKKIGMTQVFDQSGQVTPVSVVDVANWFVLQCKTNDKDGYVALQVGLLKKKHRGNSFSSDWLKNKKEYFSCVREVSCSEKNDVKVGQPVSFDLMSFQEGDKVAVEGRSKGLGFQGVVKRWNFAGGPKTHGSSFGRLPGSIGNMTSQGKVIKGKKLPGRHGFRQFTVKGLKLVRVDKENQCLFIKGAVPGKKDTVLMVRKQGI